jgi:hypothetical protein
MRILSRIRTLAVLVLLAAAVVPGAPAAAGDFCTDNPIA